MRLRDGRFLAAVLMAAGVLVVGRTALADPPDDGCSNRCQERTSFIDSALLCYTYSEPDCVNCVNGRCKDSLVGPIQPCKSLIDRVTVKTYPKGSCTPICNLNVGSRSESTAPTMGVPTSAEVSKNICDYVSPMGP